MSEDDNLTLGYPFLSQPYSSVIRVNKPLLTYAVYNFLFIAAVCALIPRSYSNVSINYSAINMLWYITIIATWWSSKLKLSKLETKYTLFAYNHRYYGMSVICIFFLWQYELLTWKILNPVSRERLKWWHFLLSRLTHCFNIVTKPLLTCHLWEKLTSHLLDKAQNCSSGTGDT